MQNYEGVCVMTDEGRGAGGRASKPSVLARDGAVRLD